MNYWLFKSEPDCFSIDDLRQAPNQTEHWDGVRNYQARNFMRDAMKIHDKGFFYHSNAQPPGIIGVVEIVSQGYPDHTAFDPNSEHPDFRSTPDKPLWYMVDVRFVRKFEHLLSLDSLRQYPELADMPLLRKGNRLSVMPVSSDEWTFIMNIAK